MFDFVLSLVGLVSGLVGALILAFSLNRIVEELVLAFESTDTTLEALISSQHVPKFTGMDRRLKAGLTSAKSRTNLGLILLAISFAFQLLALILQDGHS
jgi:hypothetical protein